MAKVGLELLKSECRAGVCRLSFVYSKSSSRAAHGSNQGSRLGSQPTELDELHNSEIGWACRGDTSFMANRANRGGGR